MISRTITTRVGTVGAVVVLGMVACGTSNRDFGKVAPGSGGLAGGSGAAAGGGRDGASGNTNGGGGRGGSAGVDAEGGEAGAADDAGAAGIVDSPGALAIAQPTLASSKTYVPYSATIRASGAASYSWSIVSGTLPAGLALQDTKSATVTLAGTPAEAGLFPLTLSVSDGSSSATVEVTLAVTHSALFLSDRNVSGVNELFLSEIGGVAAPAPVRLSASLPAGGSVSSYAWSPDGSKVLYLATQSAGGASEVWLASLAAPGIAQRVSAVGEIVTRMVWLGAGNVAAYSTSVGDTYLADLSGTAPSPSKLAIAGLGSAALSLQPSPNGRSLVVVGPAASGNYNDSIWVTWASGAPTAVPLLLSFPGGDVYFSYDGRFAMIAAGAGAQWADLSLPTPTLHGAGLGHGALLAWSPKAEMLLAETGGSGYEVSRQDFTGGSLAATVLVPSSLTCPRIDVQPWSPDGKHGLFACGAEVRGISNVATATVSTDFSLLPSGFLSNNFTQTYGVNWSPNSQWIALLTDRDVDNQVDLYLVRWSAPGTAYKLHANTIAAGIATWAFAQNSQAVAFVGSVSPQANAGLYLSKLPVSGAPPLATLVSAPASSVVQADIRWLPGSRVIAYRATVSGAAQLFAVPIAADGSAGAVIPISGASGSGVSSYQLAPIH